MVMNVLTKIYHCLNNNNNEINKLPADYKKIVYMKTPLTTKGQVKQNASKIIKNTK